VLIVPAGGSAEDLAVTEDELRSRELEYRVAHADGPDGAAGVAGEALRRGERFLVAVGGDAMINGVVNGMLDEGGPAAAEAVLGVVAGRAPCDLIRSFGLPSEPRRACGHLEGDRVFAIDAAAAHVASRGAHNYFVNLAEAGLGGAVSAATSRLPAGLGRVRRFAGFWMAMATFRPAEVVLRGDRRTWEGRAHQVMVANGQFGGDGYRLSPRSWPSDGYLDVLVWTGPRSDSYRVLPKAVLGEHLPHPDIIEYRCRTLSVESSRPWPVQADGRAIGSTPVSFQVLPEAVRLKI
jgi:diacylglycerol kinase (ATP)